MGRAEWGFVALVESFEVDIKRWEQILADFTSFDGRFRTSHLNNGVWLEGEWKQFVPCIVDMHACRPPLPLSAPSLSHARLCGVTSPSTFASSSSASPPLHFSKGLNVGDGRCRHRQRGEGEGDLPMVSRGIIESCNTHSVRSPPLPSSPLP